MNKRIADYNWGAAYLNPANQIIVVINELSRMNKADVVATAQANGLVITKAIKSVRNLGIKGHIYQTRVVA
jgi:hypothetical protein